MWVFDHSERENLYCRLRCHIVPLACSNHLLYAWLCPPARTNLILLLWITVCVLPKFFGALSQIFCRQFNSIPFLHSDSWGKNVYIGLWREERQQSLPSHAVTRGLSADQLWARSCISAIWRHLFCQKLQLIDVKWSVGSKIESTEGEKELGLQL